MASDMKHAEALRTAKQPASDESTNIPALQEAALLASDVINESEAQAFGGDVDNDTQALIDMLNVKTLSQYSKRGKPCYWSLVSCYKKKRSVAPHQLQSDTPLILQH